MTKYAKEADNALIYPDPAEFAGIVNFLQNGPALRARGYMPITGDPDDRPGYDAIPSTWTVRRSSEIRIEPRQVEGSRELVDTPVEVDTSDILVTAWRYVEIPPDEDEPEDESSSSSSSDVEPIDPADLENLPKLFSKWELIKAWEATGDINGVLAQAKNDTTLLAAWSSLPDQIDMADLLTQWAERVALYAGGRQVHKDNILKWLKWIKANREKGMDDE